MPQSAKPKPQPTLSSTLATQSALETMEKMQRVPAEGLALRIGLPRERELEENRIALTPGSVALLIANGHEVTVETQAGRAAGFQDHAYSEAGARIVYSAEEAFKENVVMKVEPPTKEEIAHMKPGTTLFSALQHAKLQAEYLKQINERRITGIAYEYIEDKGGTRPVVRSMSEIAGSCIIAIACEYLGTTGGGPGVIMGGVTGVPSTKVVVLGAGTIGEYVSRGARGLGAMVRVFDNHHYKLRRLKTELGELLYTSVIDAQSLTRELMDADVVVGALRGEEGRSPVVVTEDMVAKMKPGAIIIDASISQGGCFETSKLTSHSRPTYKAQGVLHYCVPNIPSRVARTASMALSNIFTPMLLQAGRMGGIEEMMISKAWFMKGVYTYKGHVTRGGLAQRFGLTHRDLSLLLAARM